MIEVGKYDFMLFDGDCGICAYSAEIAKRIDREKRFLVEPYQNFPEEELMKFGINYEKCSRKIQIISRKGRVYTGAIGLNYFLFNYFPWSLLVVLIYAIPLLLLLEIVGYTIVAKNRHRISRWFGLKACLIRHQSGPK